MLCFQQAKLVATATSNLCEAANMVVQGHAQEEKLIAAAKAVASSTAQLLIACQVKADARSENNRRLQVRKGRGEGIANSAGMEWGLAFCHWNGIGFEYEILPLDCIGVGKTF